MRIGLGLAGVLLLARSALAAPPCRVEVALEPALAYPGQQVVHRMRIERREDAETVEWIRAPGFPGLRAESLAMRSENAVPGGLRVREESRALFAERAGALSLAPGVLRCRTVEGSFEAPVPGGLLRVRELPEEGRPPDFAGLVGPVELQRTVTPEALSLGGSLELGIVLRGEGNLWLAPDPLPDAVATADADVFRLPAKLALRRGERLGVSQHFRYRIVPRREGTLHLPALGVAYFDPRRGIYDRAGLPALEVPVAASPSPVAPPRPRPAPPRGDGLLGAAWLWTGVKAALLLAVAGTPWLRRRRRGPR